MIELRDRLRSRSNRALSFASSANSAGNTLMATLRSRRVSCALYTSPSARAEGETISYGPSRVPDCSRKYVKNSPASGKDEIGVRVERVAARLHALSSGGASRPDDLFQRQRVVDCVGGVVVVEVDVGGFQRALPIVDAFRPCSSCLSV